MIIENAENPSDDLAAMADVGAPTMQQKRRPRGDPYCKRVLFHAAFPARRAECRTLLGRRVAQLDLHLYDIAVFRPQTVDAAQRDGQTDFAGRAAANRVVIEAALRRFSEMVNARRNPKTG